MLSDVTWRRSYSSGPIFNWAVICYLGFGGLAAAGFLTGLVMLGLGRPTHNTELLNAVFHNLNYAGDILTCATVCSSWRDSSYAVYNLKFVPFLFVSHLPADEETRLFSDQFRVLSSDFSGNTNQRWVCCGGGTQGFLLTVDCASFPFEVHLLNPFTKTVVSLPSLISFEDVQRFLESQAITETLKSFIKKVVSSSTSLLDPDWAVLIIYNVDGKLAFCRREDNQWKCLETDRVASYVDDIVLCNDLFFAIDRIEEIFHCQLSPNNPKAVPICNPSPFRHDPCKKYFAESDKGELWVVLKKIELNDDCDFATYFEIYELKRDTKEWTMVRSLRGKALFLSSQSRCVAVLASETGTKGFIKDNYVFFVEGNDPRTGLGPMNLSVFEWESKKIKKIYQPRSWNCQMFWITPTYYES